MITSEVRVNGALIGHMYIHNEKTLSPSTIENKKYCGEKCQYYIEYIPIGKGEVFMGFLEHCRDDGAVALMAKAFAFIDKKIQTDIKRRKK
jgi:hypothetical protein